MSYLYQFMYTTGITVVPKNYKCYGKRPQSTVINMRALKAIVHQVCTHVHEHCVELTKRSLQLQEKMYYYTLIQTVSKKASCCTSVVE